MSSSALPSCVVPIGQRARAEAANEELQARNAGLQNALAEMEAARRRVIRQERLRALAQMANGIAHDFNNALAPILGFTELLQMSPKILADPAKAGSYLALIHSAAKGAAGVVSRLREFSRSQEAGEAFAPVDLGKLVAQSIALTQPKWKEQAQANGAAIQIESELAPCAPISGDESALREMLANLIFNAVDAMPSGGTITIRTRRDDGFGVIEVSDTGTGMTGEVRARCLDPFFSTKGGRGTGLGLSMVLGTVERHGGTIEIESEAGEGAVFVIALPLC